MAGAEPATAMVELAGVTGTDMVLIFRAAGGGGGAAVLEIRGESAIDELQL